MKKLPPKKKPPYTAVKDIDAFFSKMPTTAAPGKIDTKWVTAKKMATIQPAGIAALLRWLGVIDKDAKPDVDLWNRLRTARTQQDTLEELLTASYTDIFSQFDPVDAIREATADDLHGAFVTAYESGNPRRPISCFRALCQRAGLMAGAESERATTLKDKKTSVGRKGRESREAPADVGKKRSSAGQSAAVVSVQIQVEIPAEWTEEQVRQRIALVRQAIAGGNDGSA